MEKDEPSQAVSLSDQFSPFTEHALFSPNFSPNTFLASQEQQQTSPPLIPIKPQYPLKIAIPLTPPIDQQQLQYMQRSSSSNSGRINQDRCQFRLLADSNNNKRVLPLNKRDGKRMRIDWIRGRSRLIWGRTHKGIRGIWRKCRGVEIFRFE
ncbi:MAG: hypothetical protein EZS28_036199 [Streblomastix strix]|uniref:Uncharacterized protein n=1 Tax=Streblomastix strix TaxID=222440 RepID=A0A5J4UFD3_9EUKA|nr:MAG: hypothetical protein EZS28_036199 [Streblomastix strix]